MSAVPAIAFPIGESLILGYLCGSLPFGFIVGKLRGMDIRRFGSGNIGATNVGRALGGGAFLLVLALDAAKGFLPTFFLSPQIAGASGGRLSADLAAVLVAAGTLIGHSWTVFLRFRGGKGVATGAGALLALAPEALGCGLVVWLAAVAATRYISVGSMAAALAVAIGGIWIFEEDPFGRGLAKSIFLAGAAILVIARHGANIKRLLAGSENKIGRRARVDEPDTDNR